MRNAPYLRLAVTNMLRSRRSYIPYLIAASVMCAICSICANLAMGSSISNMNYGATTRSMLEFGLYIMVIFTTFYMFYINSFLIKRRAREFGLYGVLGFGRSQTARVVFWEGVMLCVLVIGLGLLVGFLLGGAVFKLLITLTHLAPDSRYTVAPASMYFTVIMFGAIFLLNTIYNMFRVWKSRPLELMKSERSGEKKAKAVAPRAIIGLLLLGGAYWLSLSAADSAFALLLFWPAVLMVILATHQLFLGGSVAILGLMKRSKRFYYNRKNFVPIGGLIYRMKQNASGLANICILSTMVLVTVSMTLALYFGGESAGSSGDFYALFGGLLFMGFFFAILFLTNMTLIIYFKQVSEGTDDRENFALLRRVGMDEKMVKKTINKQVLIVFFAPLVVALAHTCASSGMLNQILGAFLYCNPKYLWVCIGGTAAVFAVVYCVVYKLTSHAYYTAAK